jgi:integrase
MPQHFTDTLVANLECPAGQKDKLFFDDEQKGLGVRVTQSGGRVFIVQWTDTATGQKRREVLGAYGAITTDQARKAAAVYRGDVAKGLDPHAERLAKAEALRKAKEAAKQAREAAKAAKLEAAFTLERLVTDWAAIGLAKRRPRYKAEAVRALRYGFPKDWTRPASALTKARIVAIQDTLTKEEKHASASRLTAYGRACFTWAVKRGTLALNPFQGLRREEVAAMRWSEISLDLSVWTIPAQRMKRGQAHSVTLTDAAREALGAVTRIDGQDMVFTTTGKTPISGFSKIKTKLDKLSGVTGWVLHDFRRAGPSTLARLGFSSIVADKLLAHQPSALSSVARTYQQHDFNAEKKVALEAWAAHVLRCAKPESEGDKVTSLAEHRAARAG